MLLVSRKSSLMNHLARFMKTDAKVNRKDKQILWGRFVTKEEKAEFNPVVERFIEKINNNQRSSYMALKYYQNFISSYRDRLHMWELLGPTKETIIKLLREPDLFPSLGEKFIFCVMHHMTILKRRSPMWKLEAQHSDLFNEFDNYLLKHIDNFKAANLASLLKAMSQVNYQNERLMSAFVPRILTAKDVTLKDTLKVIRALWPTKMANDPNIRLMCQKNLESKSALIEFQSFRKLDKANTLLRLVGFRSYTTPYFEEGLKSVQEYKNQSHIGFQVHTVLNFLYHADRHLHNINLAPFDKLKALHEYIWKENIQAATKKVFISKFEEEIANYFAKEVSKIEGASIELQRLFDYFSIDICLQLKGEKPLAIEVTGDNEFRNDILDVENIIRYRWLKHKGYKLLVYNNEVHEKIMKSEKGLSGLLEMLNAE